MIRRAIVFSIILLPVASIPLLGVRDAFTFTFIVLGLIAGSVIQWAKFRMIVGKTLPTWVESLLPFMLLLTMIVLGQAHPDIRITHEIAITFALATGGFISLKTNRAMLANQFFIGTTVFVVVMFAHLALEKILGYPLYVLEVYDHLYIYIAAGILAAEVILMIVFAKFQVERSKRYQDLESENLWFSSTFGLVSHNLKTPLANIQGQVDLIRLIVERKGELSQEELKSKLDQIEGSLNASKATLEATIQNYKSLISTLNKSKRNLGHLMEELAGKYEGLEYNFDSEDLRSVPLTTQGFFVFNLNLEVYIDNSVKYAGHLPKIRVLNRRIQIIDQGPGFSEDLIRKLGGSVVQSSGGGNGLGMFLAISLLRTVDWDLSISNTNPGAILEIHEQKRL